MWMLQLRTIQNGQLLGIRHTERRQDDFLSFFCLLDRLVQLFDERFMQRSDTTLKRCQDRCKCKIQKPREPQQLFPCPSFSVNAQDTSRQDPTYPEGQVLILINILDTFFIDIDLVLFYWFFQYELKNHIFTKNIEFYIDFNIDFKYWFGMSYFNGWTCFWLVMFDSGTALSSCIGRSLCHFLLASFDIKYIFTCFQISTF